MSHSTIVATANLGDRDDFPNMLKETAVQIVRRREDEIGRSLVKNYLNGVGPKFRRLPGFAEDQGYYKFFKIDHTSKIKSNNLMVRDLKDAIHYLYPNIKKRDIVILTAVHSNSGLNNSIRLYLQDHRPDLLTYYYDVDQPEDYTDISQLTLKFDDPSETVITPGQDLHKYHSTVAYESVEVEFIVGSKYDITSSSVLSETPEQINDISSLDRGNTQVSTLTTQEHDHTVYINRKTTYSDGRTTEYSSEEAVDSVYLPAGEDSSYTVTDGGRLRLEVTRVSAQPVYEKVSKSDSDTITESVPGEPGVTRTIETTKEWEESRVKHYNVLTEVKEHKLGVDPVNLYNLDIPVDPDDFPTITSDIKEHFTYIYEDIVSRLTEVSATDPFSKVFPPVPFKRKYNWISGESESKSNSLLDSSLGIKYKDIQDNLVDANIDEYVKNIILNYAVPVNTKGTISKKYIREFFKEVTGENDPGSVNTEDTEKLSILAGELQGMDMSGGDTPLRLEYSYQSDSTKVIYDPDGSDLLSIIPSVSFNTPGKFNFRLKSSVLEQDNTLSWERVYVNTVSGKYPDQDKIDSDGMAIFGVHEEYPEAITKQIQDLQNQIDNLGPYDLNKMKKKIERIEYLVRRYTQKNLYIIQEHEDYYEEVVVVNPLARHYISHGDSDYADALDVGKEDSPSILMFFLEQTVVNKLSITEIVQLTQECSILTLDYDKDEGNPSFGDKLEAVGKTLWKGLKSLDFAGLVVVIVNPTLALTVVTTVASLAFAGLAVSEITGQLGEILGSQVAAEIVVQVVLAIFTLGAGNAATALVQSITRMSLSNILLNVVTMASDAYVDYIQDKTQDEIEEAEKFISELNKETDAINELLDEITVDEYLFDLVNPALKSETSEDIPSGAWEDRETFLNRTLMSSSDIIDMSHNLVFNVVDVQKSSMEF